MGIFDNLFGKSRGVKMAARRHIEDVLGSYATVRNVRFKRVQYVENTGIWEVEGEVKIELHIVPFSKQTRNFECKINPDTGRVIDSRL